MIFVGVDWAEAHHDAVLDPTADGFGNYVRVGTKLPAETGPTC
jgi:hypothetical protein